jgi:hypothetical protein
VAPRRLCVDRRALDAASVRGFGMGRASLGGIWPRLRVFCRLLESGHCSTRPSARTALRREMVARFGQAGRDVRFRHVVMMRCWPGWSEVRPRWAPDSG